MKMNYTSFWASVLFSLLILPGFSITQTIAEEQVKSHKLASPVKALIPSISLKPSGKILYIDIKPSPATIEIYSGKRRLATIKGKKRTQFDITRYATSASGGRLLIVVKDNSGKQHSKNLDVSRYAKTTTIDEHKVVPRTPSPPAPPEREGRMVPGGPGYQLDSPRANSSASPSGNRPASATGTMSQSPASRLSHQDDVRITSITPQPAVVGKNFTINGENFGSTRGTASLEAAELTVRPSIRRWSDSTVELVVPEGLEPLVGYDTIHGRVWLYPADRQSGATSRLEIAPDPDTLSPLMHNAPLSVEPGDGITITGEQFLSPAGTVSLDCPGGGITTRVESWSNSRIQVTPAAALSKPVESNDCTLVVTNHRGMTTRRGIYLNVLLKQETWRTTVSHSFSHRRYSLPPADLENGWVIVTSSFKVDPDRLAEEFYWVQQPPVGGRAMRGIIDGKQKAGPRPLGTREITFSFSLEGPRKLPHYR